MIIMSTLKLDTLGRKANGAGELGETRHNRDAEGLHFRNHAWLIICQLVNFYQAAAPKASLPADLRSLAGAMRSLADDLEKNHAKPA